MALSRYGTILRPSAFTVNTELSLGLGATTIVYMTSAVNLTFFGLAATGGNIDGMVCTLVNLSLGSIAHSFAYESGSASDVRNRFWLPALTTLTTSTGIGAMTVRYDGTVQRWIAIGRA